MNQNGQPYPDLVNFATAMIVDATGDPDRSTIWDLTDRSRSGEGIFSPDPGFDLFQASGVDRPVSTVRSYLASWLGTLPRRGEGTYVSVYYDLTQQTLTCRVMRRIGPAQAGSDRVEPDQTEADYAELGRETERIIRQHGSDTAGVGAAVTGAAHRLGFPRTEPIQAESARHPIEPDQTEPDYAQIGRDVAAMVQKGGGVDWILTPWADRCRDVWYAVYRQLEDKVNG